MGRPPLNKKAGTISTTIRLDADVKQRIDAVAGANRMAAFIREAIEEKLEREAKPQRPAKPSS